MQAGNVVLYFVNIISTMVNQKSLNVLSFDDFVANLFSL
jgi:hypothetical protein